MSDATTPPFGTYVPERNITVITIVLGDEIENMAKSLGVTREALGLAPKGQAGGRA